jgi:hypothetical protein
MAHVTESFVIHSLSAVLCATVIYRSVEKFENGFSKVSKSPLICHYVDGKYFPAFQRRLLPLENLVSLLFLDPEQGGSKLF